MTATGNCVEVQSSGTIFYNSVTDLFLQTDNSVTPTSGAMVYTDPSSEVGYLGNLTMLKVWVGLLHTGTNWTGDNITVLNPQGDPNSICGHINGVPVHQHSV